MTTPRTTPRPRTRAGQLLDANLARTVRHTALMRQGFYVVVLLVALAGQVSGAVESLHLPLISAIPAVGALELGGVVVLANADVRRRLGESALASRVLSAVIAAGAAAFNWLAHADHLRGGFFAGMSALGYLVWLMHTENQRRDRLRAVGDLAPTTPRYEAVGHWLTHPALTRRARSLAKADPRLGLYDSLATARADIRRERRQAAIASVLHRKIRAAVDQDTAAIACAVYDLDTIAARLADSADYDALTALIGADLTPARLAPVAGQATTPPVPVIPPELTGAPLLLAQLGVPVSDSPRTPPPPVALPTPVPVAVPVPVARIIELAPRRAARHLPRPSRPARPARMRPVDRTHPVASVPPVTAPDAPATRKAPARTIAERTRMLADIASGLVALTPATGVTTLGIPDADRPHVARVLRGHNPTGPARAA